MLLGGAEPGSDEERAKLVAVQRGDVGFVVQPGGPPIDGASPMNLSICAAEVVD